MKSAAITPPPAPVSRVPGELLFADLLATCPGETDAQTESRVRLTLESDAPLPTSRLAWGWRRTGAGVLYYAGRRDRLAAGGWHTDTETAHPILPEFAPGQLPAGVDLAETNAPARATRHADLRDRALLARLAEEAGRQAKVRLLRRAALIPAVLAVLIAAAAGLIAARTAVLRSRIRELTPRLAAAEAVAAAEAELAASAAARDPLGALALVNDARPDGVTLARYELRRNGRIVVTGGAESVDAANRFLTALGATGAFTGVTMESLDTADGRAGFRIAMSVAPAPAGGKAAA